MFFYLQTKKSPLQNRSISRGHRKIVKNELLFKTVIRCC
jgi:hypothetical protein